MAPQKTKPIRYTKAAIKPKTKMGGRKIVSKALVKEGSSNLVPKIHVKRGDLVIVRSGSKEVGKGKTGKVIAVFPRTGKVIVEGVNVITRATRQRQIGQKSGLIKKEAPIFASRVMLYDTKKKKGVRKEARKAIEQ
jgi:large subunit ribosomal protein L24